MTRLKHKILYLDIYVEYVNKIKTNQIKANEKLPSKRNLADNKNVSLITIEKAYDQLLQEGYIYSIEKKGYYVNQIELTTNKKIINKPKEEKQINLILQAPLQETMSSLFQHGQKHAEK